MNADQDAEMTLDDILGDKAKDDLYRMCAKAVAGKMWNVDGAQSKIEDIAVEVYSKLVQKRVGDFKLGVPNSDVEWGKLLNTAARFERATFKRDSSRHPTSSLDEPVGEDGGENAVMTRMDCLDYDSEASFQPNYHDPFMLSDEAQLGLEHLHEICARVWEKSNVRTQAMLEDMFFRHMGTVELEKKHGMNPGTIYVAKKRFMKHLENDGRRVFEEIMAHAA